MDAIEPRGLHLVEAFPSAGRIHLYSRAFVTRLIASGSELPPATFECFARARNPGG